MQWTPDRVPYFPDSTLPPFPYRLRSQLSLFHESLKDRSPFAEDVFAAPPNAPSVFAAFSLVQGATGGSKNFYPPICRHIIFFFFRRSAVFLLFLRSAEPGIKFLTFLLKLSRTLPSPPVEDTSSVALSSSSFNPKQRTRAPQQYLSTTRIPSLSNELFCTLPFQSGLWPLQDSPLFNIPFVCMSSLSPLGVLFFP